MKKLPLFENFTDLPVDVEPRLRHLHLPIGSTVNVFGADHEVVGYTDKYLAIVKDPSGKKGILSDDRTHEVVSSYGSPVTYTK